MKKLVGIFLMILLMGVAAYALADVSIDEANYPDFHFRQYITQFDKDGNKILTDSELADVKNIEISSMGISSLKGIEYFTSLEYLYCDNNPLLTQLDVSMNKWLKDIDCRFCPIESIDLKNNVKMQVLSCGWDWENGDRRTISVNVNNCPELVYFECIGLKLRDLDLRYNSALQYLYLSENELTTLDVSKNTELLELWCTQNRLTELDVSNCLNLKELTCADNLLASINVKNNTELRYFSCPGNQISELDVFHNTKLKTLYCEANNITILDISNCDNLRELVNSSKPYSMTSRVDYKQWNDDDYILGVDTNVTVIASRSGISDFVTRCYEIILGRKPDVGGLNTWVNELNSGRKAAAEIIEQFVASAEFQNKNLSNADAVEILYKAMLGRGSDPSGKADWLAKLNAGQHITAVINGFCGSAEFKAICDSYGIQPGTVTVKDGTPVTPGADNEKIKAYVERCYQIILGRGADEGGLNTWMDELTSGRKAAAEIIEQFVASAEFQNKKLSNSDSVEILYKAMLGRGSDPAGKASWVEKLDAGQDLTAVINGFCGSAEFKAICDSYGIQPGTVTVKQPTAPTANDEKIRAFVSRCYKIILGRDADEGGMNTWAGELKSGRKAAAEIIEAFINSQEFKNKNYSNPDAVEILYKAMLGRGSDPAGKADWVAKLNAGQPLEAVINGFCGSAEFKAICDAYGITPGTVNVPQLSKIAVMQEIPAEKPVVKETVNNVTRVEITNASDTVNEQLGTAVQAIYINEEKAKEFIGRCYRVILGREASQAELESWIGQMTNGSKTADQIARGFLFSGEFKGRNVSNEELVKILYRVYMNREADPEGLATWTQKLDEGTGLNELLDVFAKTNEFKAVLKDMAR